LGEAADLKLQTPIKYADLLKWFDNDDKRTQIFNPHITAAARKNKIQIPKGAVISVPLAKQNDVAADLELMKKPTSKKTRQARTSELIQDAQ
jgi:hypothetical protein